MMKEVAFLMKKKNTKKIYQNKKQMNLKEKIKKNTKCIHNKFNEFRRN